jgi:hypothetical protein
MLLSLFHATDETYLECPVNDDRHFAVVAFQTLMVLSALPLAKDAPSGLHATE